MKLTLRQGDVALIPVNEIPKAAKIGKRDGGRIVLAYGEVTGHAHAILDKAVKVYEHEGTRYIRVPRAAKLQHEEHGAIALAPGDYEVRLQREYVEKEIRRVAD